MFWIKMNYKGHVPTLALSVLCCKFISERQGYYTLEYLLLNDYLPANLLTCRTYETSSMQPVVVYQSHLYLLSRIKARERLIKNLQMQPSLLT